MAIDFIVRTELQKAAFGNGFRIERPDHGNWVCFASTTALGEIWLCGESPTGPWRLAISHMGAGQELGWHASAGPGQFFCDFDDLELLYQGLERVYQLSSSLPDLPLTDFIQQTNRLPRSTEAERLVIQRVGQDIFRNALLKYWDGHCPMTGISSPLMLRASHIVPWAECDDDAHRLDVHNGLLLSALWDSAFDAGLVSFDDSGTVLTHPRLTAHDRDHLLNGTSGRLTTLKPQHLTNLARHRRRFGFI
jgi:HNH endonuclease